MFGGSEYEDQGQDDLAVQSQAQDQALESKSQQGNCAIKILLSNKHAGSLIGKNGSTILSFQAATGSRVRVSRADESFPGTQYRVVLITGAFDAVAACLTLIIEQVHKHFADYPFGDKEAPSVDLKAQRTLNLVVPSGSSGLIIGRRGETVRAMAGKSGSHIQLAGMERQVAGLSERVLSLTGTLQGNLSAASFILQLLSEDPSGKYDNLSTTYRSYNAPQQYQPPLQQQPSHMQNLSQPYGHSQSPYGLGGLQSGLPGLGPGPARGGAGGILAASTTLTLQVPDELVPTLLGKGGSVMKDMEERSGARIRVSQKGDFVPGTSNRLVTISAGTHHEAHNAYLMVAHRIGFA
mmetsp:Transcript_3253/g.7636  ORF Transcript_3253/g.7636 Transcript_3253/m.7636 type:complete len:351 (-) Transcript_3253:228-1280(-)